MVIACFLLQNKLGKLRFFWGCLPSPLAVQTVRGNLSGGDTQLQRPCPRLRGIVKKEFAHGTHSSPQRIKDDGPCLSRNSTGFAKC